MLKLILPRMMGAGILLSLGYFSAFVHPDQYTTLKDVNILNSTSGDAGEVLKVSKGKSLMVTGSDDTWVYVLLTKNLKGFVRKQHLKKERNTTELGGWVMIVAGAGFGIYSLLLSFAYYSGSNSRIEILEDIGYVAERAADSFEYYGLWVVGILCGLTVLVAILISI